MKITNRAKLPDAIVKAIENDPYSKGNADFSVTELLGPARAAALKITCQEEVEEDAEDRLHSLYGQIVHTILERSNRKGLAEKRFYGFIDTYKVSAQIDTLDIENGILTDYKFTTAWKFKRDSENPPEWVAQLNMQLELLRQNGHDAKELQIVGLLRDFSKMEARRNPDYPQASVMGMHIPIWPREKTIKFMSDRIKAHLDARKTLPECTEDERWAKETKWALMKKGQKRAVKLYENEADANLAASMTTGHFVEKRPGESVRCELYCPVNRFCSQYQKTKTQTEEPVLALARSGSE